MNAIVSVLLSKLTAALSSTALLLMFANAQVNTAPDQLWPRGQFVSWLWTWQVHAWRLFISSRNPALPPAQVATLTETHSVTASVMDPNQPAATVPQKEQK